MFKPTPLARSGGDSVIKRPEGEVNKLAEVRVAGVSIINARIGSAAHLRSLANASWPVDYVFLALRNEALVDGVLTSCPLLR